MVKEFQHFTPPPAKWAFGSAVFASVAKQSISPLPLTPTLSRGRGGTSRIAAFSLVELSIVLVILGLLTGGVLVGQNLIRDAELRAVTTEFATYQTAIMTFKDTYIALPGDMPDATKFWKVSTSGCPLSVAGHVLTDGTCSSGMAGTLANGFIAGSGHAYNSKENFWAWHHLQLAGLVAGNFTGYPGLGHSYYDAVAGKNVPQSKLGGNAAWCFNAIGNDGSSGWNFAVNFGNSLGIGGAFEEADALYCGQGVFLPQEAWMIDTKMDDGMPARGTIIAGPITRCTDAWTTTTNYDAKYSLSGTASTVKYCMLNFALGVGGGR